MFFDTVPTFGFILSIDENVGSQNFILGTDCRNSKILSNLFQINKFYFQILGMSSQCSDLRTV